MYKLNITKLDFCQKFQKLEYRFMFIKYNIEINCGMSEKEMKNINNNVINNDLVRYYQKTQIHTEISV